jgi:potassium-transporting ATPase KdpC subunit
MKNEFIRQLRPALLTLALLTALTGLVYPAITTAVAHALLAWQASGSIVESNGKPLGSELIAQPFTEPRYFWPRPSACGYNAASSCGSNLGPTNDDLTSVVRARARALRDADPGNTKPIPVDLVTASGSGLDPHLSPVAVEYQVPRVARVRGVPEEKVRELALHHVEGPSWRVLGEPRVNVLRLNLALDSLVALRTTTEAK